MTTEKRELREEVFSTNIVMELKTFEKHLFDIAVWIGRGTSGVVVLDMSRIETHYWLKPLMMAPWEGSQIIRLLFLSQVSIKGQARNYALCN